MNNGKAAFPEFHHVYIDPASWAHWKDAGEFGYSAIMIKELVSVGSKSAVSGNGYFEGDFIGLEATIKSTEHNPDEPGNWSYYRFSTPGHKTLSATAKAFPKAACNACYAASAEDDIVFTQYYPVLRNGQQITFALCLSFCPPSALQKQLISSTIRLLSRLEYEQKIWRTILKPFISRAFAAGKALVKMPLVA